MATIFLSYRRSDAPQACRVYDWLRRRFGDDAIFMDVATIPFAVNFPDFLGQAIEQSKVLIVLIGDRWAEDIQEPGDYVRMEIELAIANQVQVLPVLIGNTPMPDASELPASISMLTYQNAVTVGMFHDFHSHMQALLPKIEMILGTLADHSVATADPHFIERACSGIIQYLQQTHADWPEMQAYSVEWHAVGASDLAEMKNNWRLVVTLYLHRVTRLEEQVELHFVLSVWANETRIEHLLAGWVMSQMEKTPVIPPQFLHLDGLAPEYDFELKIRRSSEDARQVWQMMTDEIPLRLSFTYIATIGPVRRD